MTPDELDEMERLWAAHVRIEDIADAIGYSTPTIVKAAASDRKRYPSRKGLTPVQMSEVERLWRRRKPIEEIARLMGVPGYVIQNAVRSDRKRFPPRHKHVPRAVAAEWAERIGSGKATVAEASKTLGVHPVTVAGWLRRYGR